MKLNQAQLEWIVREVVRRLQSPDTPGEVAAGASRLSLADRLVTTETLRNKLVGVTHVDTVAGAVVTPAVVDLLRDRNIKLVRGNGHQGALRCE